jgi:hypothetical protein
VHGQVRFLHEGIRPNLAHKLFFFHELPVPLDEKGQHLDGLARQRHQLSIAKKEALRGVQPKRSELPVDVFWSTHRDARPILELIKASFRTFRTAKRFHDDQRSGQAPRG